MSSLKTAHILAGGKRGVDWQKSTSPNGFYLAEVVSAVYKEARRGKEKESLAWALEMVDSGEEATDFLWENLLVFAIEDIGLADTSALGVAFEARKLFYLLPRGDSRRLAVLSFAICHFCRCKKTRYSNELLLVLKREMAEGRHQLEMPDYAVDKHTARGRQLGRKLHHYLTDASHLENRDGSFPTRFRDELVARARADEGKIN